MVHNITQVLVLEAGGVQATDIRKKYRLDRLLTEVNCNIGSISSYRIIPVTAPLIFEPSYVIKLHGGRKPFADFMISAGLIKPTFIFRDPRDAALSVYEYGQTAKDIDYVNNDFAHIRSIEEAIDYIYPYIAIARGWLSSKNVFVVKYEDMFINFDEIINNLLIFLGIDLNIGKAMDLIEKFQPGVNVVNRRFTHFKKGKVGRHQQIFSQSQLDYCDQKFGDFLHEYGYID